MLKRSGIILAAVAMLAAPLLSPRLLAQRGGMGMMPPGMSGVWNPVIGSGATYEMTGKDGKKTLLTIAVVNKEDFNGHPGFWMEYLIADKDGKDVVMQMLMVKDGASMTMPKMVIQPPGQPPMEMSSAIMGMMAARGGGAAPAAPKPDAREGGENLGAESVTTPAGTFQCEHWRSKDGASVWIAPNAGPWGMVTTQSADTSMVMLKVITDAKSHIVGTPQSMDSMMGGRGRGQD
jgi:hypothetical protein